MNRKDKLRKIEELRKSGYSYREILKKVRVSKRDITKISKKTNFSREGKIRYFTKVTGIVRPIKKQKSKLTPEKTRIIGNLLFDGSVYKTTGYHHTISYVNSSKYLVLKLCRDIEKVYGVKPFTYEEKGKTLIYYRILCKSKEMYLDLLRYSPSYSTSSKLVKVPYQIMNGPKEIKINFLRTFWDNEGSISKEGKLRGSSNSKKVISQLNKIHKDLKFKTKIYQDNSKTSTSYILSISKNMDNLKRFYKYQLFTDSIVTNGKFKGLNKINVVKYFLPKRS